MNNSYKQYPSRWAINFKDFDELKCKTDYPECYEIILEYVKPERDKNSFSKSAKEKWWLYERSRPELYSTIKYLKKVLVVAQTSKTVAFCFVPQGYIYAMGTVVFAYDKHSHFAILQSTIHNQWAWKNGSTMKTDLRYTPTDVFETFPFPNNIASVKENILQEIGEIYHNTRWQLMLSLKLGLTKIYNFFHTKDLSISEIQRTSKQDEVICKKAFDVYFYHS